MARDHLASRRLYRARVPGEVEQRGKIVEDGFTHLTTAPDHALDGRLREACQPEGRYRPRQPAEEREPESERQAGEMRDDRLFLAGGRLVRHAARMPRAPSVRRID